MNNLTVKQVDFLGDELLAIQEKNTGKVHTAINSILRGLGFDEKQIEYQRDKWCTDRVIAKGTQKFSGTLLNAKTGKDIWCIEILKLPLALAKINITPKMENEVPDLAKKLELYQDKCGDVLAEAFIPEKFTKQEEAKTTKQKTLASINNDAKIILPQLEAAGVDPVQRTYFLKDIYAPVGVAVPMVRVEQEKLYEQTEMAAIVGLYSEAGKPHAQAIGAIMTKFVINDTDIVKTSYSRNGHNDIAEQYKEPVLSHVKEWLADNGYPTLISNGKKNFKVFYKELETA